MMSSFEPVGGRVSLFSNDDVVVDDARWENGDWVKEETVRQHVESVNVVDCKDGCSSVTDEPVYADSSYVAPSQPSVVRRVKLKSKRKGVVPKKKIVKRKLVSKGGKKKRK